MCLKYLQRFIAPRKTSETSTFYDSLIDGGTSRKILSVDKRYKVTSESQNSFLTRYFDQEVTNFIRASDRVLDFGCGSGIFSRRLSEMCSEVIGIDISRRFIEVATIESRAISNLTFIHLDERKVFFAQHKDFFDLVLLVDVLHHLQDPAQSLIDVLVTLKPGGKMLIYEPNLKNPILFMMHLFDKNERGLLSLGTIKRYSRMLNTSGVNITKVKYNGIVIGPANKMFWWVSRFLEFRYLGIFRWLNPKIFISCVKE